MALGRLVAPITTTEARFFIPSISVSSCDTMRRSTCFWWLDVGFGRLVGQCVAWGHTQGQAGAGQPTQIDRSIPPNTQ